MCATLECQTSLPAATLSKRESPRARASAGSSTMAAASAAEAEAATQRRAGQPAGFAPRDQLRRKPAIHQSPSRKRRAGPAAHSKERDHSGLGKYAVAASALRPFCFRSCVHRSRGFRKPLPLCLVTLGGGGVERRVRHAVVVNFNRHLVGHFTRPREAYPPQRAVKDLPKLLR